MSLKYLGTYASEKEYRADKTAWNYSKIKDGLKHPLSYRKRHILGDNSEDIDNEGLRDGHLIDVRLLGTETDFEEKYHISNLSSLPTEKRKKFADILMELTSQQTVDDVFQGDFIETCRKTWDIIGGIGNSKFETFIEKFPGSDIELYYSELRQSVNKTVISLEKLEKADTACRSLKTEEGTREFFQGEGINQLPIQYELNGKRFRCMFDRVKIDHKNKTLEFSDVKNCFEPHEFLRQYLKLGYYIQQGVYSEGGVSYRDALFPDYEILPFSFYVVDIENYHRPLKWTMEFGLENPWNGFTHNYKYYKGIWTIIEDIGWHIENDEWRIKKNHFDSKGQVIYKIGD